MSLLREEFEKSGFIILRNIIPHHLIDDAISDCKGKYTNGVGRLNEERRIQDAWKFSNSVKKIACSEYVLKFLTELVPAATFYPFQTLNFEIGSEQPVHSDSVHFSTIPFGQMVGVWVALEDVDRENGPLVYYPRSHLLPALEGLNQAFPRSPVRDPYRHYQDYEKIVSSIVKNLELRPSFGNLAKGDAVVWSSGLFHGGSAIKDHGRTRLSQVTHYFARGSVPYTPLTSHFLNTRLTLRRPYNILDGKRMGYLDLIRACYANRFSIFTILKSLIHTKVSS